MQLNNYESRNDLLLDWVMETVPHGCSLLDVGANDGTFCPEVTRLSSWAGRLSGVDPDSARLERNPFLQEKYPSTLEEAVIPPESFDALYSFYVFEHIANPDRFIAAASSALKPGGSLFFVTPNADNYFACLSSIIGALGFQRSVLGLLREKELIDSYHYPAVYRLNRPKDIERIGRRHGFGKFEFMYCERYDEISCYFPGPSKVFPWFWEKMVETFGWNSLLLNLLGRLIKD